MKLRMTVCGFIIIFVFFVAMVKIYSIIVSENYLAVNMNQGSYTVDIGTVDGYIYDTNFSLMVNSTCEYIAVINPTTESIAEILPYVKDKDSFYEKIKKGVPFSCNVTKNTFTSNDIIVFEMPLRYSENQLASHLIGYLSDGTGVSGLEKAYDSQLRNDNENISVTFSVDGAGSVLKGENIEINNEKDLSGIVTTIDLSIQKICEEMNKYIEKGAIVVMNVKTGDILAMSSFPDFSPDNVSDYLNDENSPLINRALSAYTVGSVFKLVTSATAYESSLLDSFYYNCEGNIEIDDNNFRCHLASGHGLQNSTDALVNSCNPYFIALGQNIESDNFLKTAQKFGFGREIILCGNIYSKSGTLPSLNDLNSSGEKANFSFGQGLLTATPLQVAQFTCGIANNGTMMTARLIKGYTLDGETLSYEKEKFSIDIMQKETSEYLKNMMKAVIYDNEDTKAEPENVVAAIKTSTAQTGSFDDDGNEIYNAWVTGFFPFDDPEYAVTVLVENGESGNETAAPVFKKIVDEISDIRTFY
jgi:penicillin-binding protein 2